MTCMNNHFYMRVDKFDDVEQKDSAGYLRIHGSSQMKDTVVKFCIGTKGYEKIKQREVPDRITVLTDDYGNAYDFFETDKSTPPMIHHTQMQKFKKDMLDCINDKLLPKDVSIKLGVSSEHANYYYKTVMIENSKPAVHNYYGCVRVFTSSAWGCYFIFHSDLNILLDNEKIGSKHNFKCLPFVYGELEPETTTVFVGSPPN